MYVFTRSIEGARYDAPLRYICIPWKLSEVVAWRSERVLAPELDPAVLAYLREPGDEFAHVLAIRDSQQLPRQRRALQAREHRLPDAPSCVERSREDLPDAERDERLRDSLRGPSPRRWVCGREADECIETG